MKRAIQPNVKKVYATNVPQQDTQMNAVRKIHNLLSSGSVTVTGPSQPRILKQKIITNAGGSPASGVSAGGVSGVTILNNQANFVQKCYICDESTGMHASALTETITQHSNTKLPNKLGQIIGESFMVIISVEDVCCKSCLTMINHLDRLETDLDRVKSSLLKLIYKKYGLDDEQPRLSSAGTTASSATVPSSPPVKMQKMNSGTTTIINRKLGNDDESDTRRKFAVQQQQSRDPIENQLSTLFDDSEKPVTKIIHPSARVQQSQQGQQAQQHTGVKKQTIKIYKCMNCDFKTQDLQQFQPHHEQCKQNTFRCKTCKKLFGNLASLKQHVMEKHQGLDFTCGICNINFINDISYKKHMEQTHSDSKSAEVPPLTPVQVFTCNMCQYKTTDKQNYDEHLRKHVKIKPFKCRICAMRFETREQASIHAKTHQPNYFKCGTCSASFPQRELLVKHFETHQTKTGGTQQQQPTSLTTQKLLQDTIDEALRESEGLDPKGIHFFSCNMCSLTFIQENYYNQHMETHKRDNKKASVVTTQSIPTSSSSQSLIRQDVRNSNANLLTASAGQQSASMSEDIESIFEKMHSDKNENEASNSNSSENLVITSQENAVGGITFNITIPQQDTAAGVKTVKKMPSREQNEQQQAASSSPENVSSVGIDMPVLDQPDDGTRSEEKRQVSTSSDQPEQTSSGPVSMPSLDDDGDSQSQPSNTDQVPMDLEEMQNSVESGQIKFILNENGQILQLDNHIITTDAEGNQILVQGTDSEQIQQLLQSVGVLQTGDGLDGETLQMIGDNNQMIIVQQGDNEAQLIDASMLNADGHIVIQQAQDGELPEGAHAIGEDGVRIPVSVAYSQHEQQAEDVAMHSAEESSSQDPETKAQQQEKDSGAEGAAASAESSDETADSKAKSDSSVPTTTAAASEQTVTTTQTSSGESYFALEDLMQQSDQKSAE